MGTFIKEFGCSDASVVENTVNKYASKNDLEIRQICVVIDEKSKWRYRAIVLFQKPINIDVNVPKLNGLMTLLSDKGKR
ncbi:MULTISPECIES: hypothetical protein [Acinetobacter]|uniref:hypothetical protein n=1 Tax=Acinetobacter TaxID=469 RepID=UPI0015D2E343|nr:hypothetical protein [Acinetobacter sp. YH12043]